MKELELLQSGTFVTPKLFWSIESMINFHETTNPCFFTEQIFENKKRSPFIIVTRKIVQQRELYDYFVVNLNHSTHDDLYIFCKKTELPFIVKTINKLDESAYFSETIWLDHANFWWSAEQQFFLFLNQSNKELIENILEHTRKELMNEKTCRIPQNHIISKLLKSFHLNKNKSEIKSELIVDNCVNNHPILIERGIYIYFDQKKSIYIPLVVLKKFKNQYMMLKMKNGFHKDELSSIEILQNFDILDVANCSIFQLDLDTLSGIQEFDNISKYVGIMPNDLYQKFYKYANS